MEKELQEIIDKLGDTYSIEQEVYFKLNGKYQHVPGNPDKLEENETARNIDEYVGPQGPGYLVTHWVKKNGVVYFKREDKGPEGRSHDLREYVKEP